MKLEQVQKQNQTLSALTLQSINILQMTSAELVSFLTDEYEKNPVIELESPFRAPETAASSIQMGDSMASVTEAHPGAQWSSDDNNKERWENIAAPSDETLEKALMEQLVFIKTDPVTRAACTYLIGCLDDRGYLTEGFFELSERCEFSFDTLASALNIIQSMEPAGAGARSLQECLSIQLKRNHPDDVLALRIVNEHLEDMSKHRYSQIAHTLGCPEAKVKDACDTILSLDPIPGNAYAGKEQTEYIVPDVFIYKTENGFEVTYNSTYIPSVHISGYYKELHSQNKEDKELHSYLSEKLTQANWVVNCINQRRNALLKCASLILNRQQEFFTLGPGHLSPLRLADLTEELGGVHISTVSRIIKGKYLQCSFGVFPFNYFFSTRLSSDTAELSSDMAKRLLKEFIDAEDKAKPLSDQALSDAFSAKGFNVARRTITKYRDELGLPSAHARKSR